MAQDPAAVAEFDDQQLEFFESKVRPILIERCVSADPERFRGFYCIDPNRSAAPGEELLGAVSRGFKGLKCIDVQVFMNEARECWSYAGNVLK